MPLLLAVILFACVIGIVLALITLSLQRISGRVIEQYKERLDDANSIMDQGLPPDAWVEQFRKRIEGAADDSSPGSSPQGIPSLTLGRDKSAEEIGEQARRHCLKRLKTLTSFMEKGKFYDEDQTRDTVVKSLKNVYDMWAACHWSDLFKSDEAEQSD
ncbi:MAG: hypothetical protein OXC27_14535 [Caldilineaceae bacterium]|nr:hypothetical protein [Caldilineaceae bacterium]